MCCTVWLLPSLRHEILLSIGVSQKEAAALASGAPDLLLNSKNRKRGKWRYLQPSSAQHSAEQLCCVTEGPRAGTMAAVAEPTPGCPEPPQEHSRGLSPHHSCHPGLCSWECWLRLLSAVHLKVMIRSPLVSILRLTRTPLSVSCSVKGFLPRQLFDRADLAGAYFSNTENQRLCPRGQMRKREIYFLSNARL